MGRSYLSIKLAIVFAIAVALLMAATEHVSPPLSQAARPGQPERLEDVAPEPSPGPGLACDPAAGGARLTSLEVAIPHELLDSLPMWHGAARPDCGVRKA